MQTKPLFEEYRNGLLECVHQGTVCVVDKNGIRASVGDTDWLCYYRSASKVIQALPVISRRLDEKYGLTQEEASIFSGSHAGDEEHVRVLESILEKTGLREDRMIMLPTYPLRASEKNRLLERNCPPRRIYHNCAGKHLGMMLLARDLGEPVEDYWKRDTAAQREILGTLSKMTDVPQDEIKVGVDGCGVPVYAVPFHAIALSFLKMLSPELITDDSLAEAVMRNVSMLHANPRMVAGKDVVCSLLTADEDLIGKSGALGVYAMAIKSMGVGIVSKVMDGSHDEFAQSVIHACALLGYDSAVVREVEKLYPAGIVNDNGEIVGERRAVFSF
jgi:L-asparaginase II